LANRIGGSNSKSIEEEIVRGGSNRELWSEFVYCDKIAGERIVEYGRFDHFRDWTQEWISPCKPLHLAQNKLTPIIKKYALEVCGDDLKSGFNVEEISARSDGVRVKVRDVVSGNCFQHEFDCVIGADGAKSLVRKSLGIQQEGHFSVQKLANIHFFNQKLADLLRNRGNCSSVGPAMLYFIYNPERVCVLVAHDLNKGEFVLQIPFFEPHENLNDFTEARAYEILSAITDSSTLGNYSSIKNIGKWTMNAVVANDFGCKSSNRVFLVGDAAHQFPPSGGFGLNSGLQDVHNLSWKLATSLKSDGNFCPDLLKKTLHSYESERKSISLETSRLSMVNFNKVLNVSRTIGMNMKSMNLLLNGLRLSHAPLSLQNNIFSIASSIGRKLPSLLNSQNQASKLISSGGGLALLFPGQDLGQIYNGSSSHISPDPFSYSPRVTRGARFPHYWISRDLSTLDVISRSSAPYSPPKHTLFTRTPNSIYSLPAQVLEYDTSIRSVLVRPDGHVDQVIR
jgi:2-polyprenyl-6-methoxyphenol hydroxylase-like FAD-dependent oxidoreductase